MSSLSPIQSEIKGIEKINEFLQFIQWSAWPDAYREPKTQGELAIKLGVSPDSLSDWKKHPLFWDLVNREFKQWAKGKTGNVMAAVYKNILQNGYGSDAKFWVQYVEDWEEKMVNKNLDVIYEIKRGESEPTNPEEGSSN